MSGTWRGGCRKGGGGRVGGPTGRGVGEWEEGVRGIWEEEDGVDKVDVGGRDGGDDEGKGPEVAGV